MPVDPIAGVGLGPEFQIRGVDGSGSGGGPGAAVGATDAPAQGFGDMLSGAMDRLEGSLAEANQQSAALAAGKADDLTSVVLAVQRASLNVQLAVQVRNKAVEAYQDLFRMQI